MVKKVTYSDILAEKRQNHKVIAELNKYIREIKSGQFPGSGHSYRMKSGKPDKLQKPL